MKSPQFFVILAYLLYKDWLRKRGSESMDRRKASQLSTCDEKIIDMYWERNPDAIQKTDHKYGVLLRNVAYNILSDYQDCEECQNDTYLRIWNAIPSARPTAFPRFIMQIIVRMFVL